MRTDILNKFNLATEAVTKFYESITQELIDAITKDNPDFIPEKDGQVHTLLNEKNKIIISFRPTVTEIIAVYFFIQRDYDFRRWDILNTSAEDFYNNELKPLFK